MARRERDDPRKRAKSAARLSMARMLVSFAAAVAILAAAPLLADREYTQDAKLRATGEVSEVVVTDVRKRQGKGSCRRIVFVLDGRQQSLCDDHLDAGDKVLVVTDGKRTLKAEGGPSHRGTVIGGTTLGILFAGLVVWFGAGRGVAPRRAWRVATRRPGGVEVLDVVVLSSRWVVPPQGRAYARWRSSEKSDFYDLQLATSDGLRLGWTGLVPTYLHRLEGGDSETRCWIRGDAQLVGDVRPGGWAWLVAQGRRRIGRPAMPLAESATTNGDDGPVAAPPVR